MGSYFSSRCECKYYLTHILSDVSHLVFLSCTQLFYQDPTKKTENSYLKPVAGGRVVSTFYCYARYLPIKSSILPHTYILKHTCGEKQLATMLAIRRPAGVTPEVSLKEHTSYTPLPSVSKAAHSGFETQGRCHQKSKSGVSVSPQKGHVSCEIFF